MRLRTRHSRRWNFAAILLATVLSLPIGQALAASFDAAVQDYVNRRFESAYKEWFAAAEEGDARARYFVGLMLDAGKGVRQDHKSAFAAWLKAAGMGEPRAQARVGHILALGQRADEYLAAVPEGARLIGLTWLLRGAQNGSHRAYESLASFYCDDRFPDYDPNLAASWSLIAKQDEKAHPPMSDLLCGSSAGKDDPARAELIHMRALALRHVYALPLTSQFLDDPPFWFRWVN